MTYFSDLPLSDLTIREGDQDPIDFTLTQSDGSAIDLTNRIVELRLRGMRGDQGAKTYSSSGSSAAILVNSPTLGGIRFTVPTTPAASVLEASAGCYRGYFSVYDAALPNSPKTCPQPRDIWITMIGRLA